MITDVQLGGEGRPDALVVLLHGLDHSHESLMPVARALAELLGFMAKEGVAPPRLRVVAPYRGARDRPAGADREVTLESMVDAYYAPLARSADDVPIVTIGESLGAALSDVWSWSEKRIVHQVWLDPLPSRLDMAPMDRGVVAFVMVLQAMAFWLRWAGVNLFRVGDRALLQASLDPHSRDDRAHYLRRKMETAHWRRSLAEGWLILRMAVRGASAPRPPLDRLMPVTAFLPPRGTSWLERKVVGPLAHRIAMTAFGGRRGARIARAKAGTHYNLAEMAAPYVAWRALAGLTAAAGPAPAAELFERWSLAARFAERYWAALAGEAQVPSAPDLGWHPGPATGGTPGTSQATAEVLSAGPCPTASTPSPSTPASSQTPPPAR